ncbi:MAG TPA: hypothetical protein VGG64_04730, partial [Pirellulales bacterium]
MSIVPPARRHWFRFSLRTWFVVVTGTAVFLGWIVFDPPGTYQTNSFPNRASWQGNKFWFHWSVRDGSDERIAIDLNRPFVCATCIVAYAKGNMGSTVYCMLVLIALERLVLPLWVLAAIVVWKIGRALAARHGIQMFRHIVKDDAVRRPPPSSRY